MSKWKCTILCPLCWVIVFKVTLTVDIIQGTEKQDNIQLSNIVAIQKHQWPLNCRVVQCAVTTWCHDHLHLSLFPLLMQFRWVRLARLLCVCVGGVRQTNTPPNRLNMIRPWSGFCLLTCPVTLSMLLKYHFYKINIKVWYCWSLSLQLSGQEKASVRRQRLD